MKQVFAYVRVSTVKQGERGSSLEEQRAAIQAYARLHGLTITRWFEEKETAAKRGRRLFNELLALLRQRKSDGVIIHKIDRSARNLRDWADLGTLMDEGIDVHFAHESVDLRTRGGRLTADLQAVIAADFIRNLRDEVKKGFYGRLKQGFYPLPAPLGYRDHGGGQVKTLDPVSAPLVRRAFELYSTGCYSLETLGAELYRLGLRNRRGGRVTRNGLSTMLNNEFYLGLIHIAKTGERFSGNHEPLVTKRLFDEVQSLLLGRTSKRPLKHDFLYRRTLRCAYCEKALIGELAKGRVYYRCHDRACPTTCVREDDLLAQMRQHLRTVAVPPEDYDLLANEFQRMEEGTKTRQNALLHSLRLRLAQVERRLDGLMDAYIDEAITKDAFERRNGQLLRERLELREKIGALAGGGDIVRQSVRQFLELLKELSEGEKEENARAQRTMLKEATSNLSVKEKVLVIGWRPPFQILANRHISSIGRPQRDTDRTPTAQESHVAPRHISEASYEVLIGPACSLEPSQYLGQGRHRNRARVLTARETYFRHLARRLYRAIEAGGEAHPDAIERTRNQHAAHDQVVKI